VRLNTAICFVLLSVLLSPATFAQNINTVVGGGKPNSHARLADLARPSGVVKDSSGNIYLTGGPQQYVYKLLSSGTLTVVAGKGYGGIGGAGGKAAKAIVDNPVALALDKKGNLFIADGVSNHVWSVDHATGTFKNVAGNTTETDPFGGYTGDGGPATSAQLSDPQGVGVDSAGNVFIADTVNNVIRTVNTSGMISTFAGNGTACADPTTPCGDGGAARQANLNNPVGIWADAGGNLFIADAFDNRIRRVVAKTLVITTVAGNGTPCFPSTGSCGDGGPATQANLNNPQAVSMDVSGNLYIADRGDSRIRVVNAQSGIITTVVGTGVSGFSGDGGPATAASLNRPSGVFVDKAGNILIADNLNNRFREVTASNGLINTIAGGGSGGDGGLATRAILAGPNNLALDASGNQYIADVANQRIRRVDAKSGKITTVAGIGIGIYSGDNGPATKAGIRNPQGLTVDASGNLFIADSSNNVIRRVDATTQTITTYAGMFGSFCFPPTDPCGDGGPATSASFNFPSSVAVDKAGNLFIVDDGDNRVRRVDAVTQVITTVAGDGNVCPLSTEPCGDEGPATSAQLNGPFGMAVDSKGNLLIVDSGDNRVRRVDASTQIITTVAFNGEPAFNGDGGPAVDASMWGPLAIAVDPSGNFFVGGGYDEVVQRIDAKTGTVTTVAGDASQPLTFGFHGDGGPATKAILGNIGVAVDGSGNLYIGDTGNQRIRHVHLAAEAEVSP